MKNPIVRKRFPKRGRPGATLIEALISIIILGIALLGLAQLFLVSLTNNARGGETSQATSLAQQQVDYLRTLTSAELATFPSTARSETDDEAIDMNLDGTLDFRRLTRIQATGYVYSVRVLIFPPSRIGKGADDLLQDPASYRALAVLNAVIGR